MNSSSIGRQTSAKRCGRHLGVALALLGIAWLAAPTPAAAEPMDLANPKARWVSVRFETSPAEKPGQINAVYMEPIRAWLEPADESSVRRVVIAGRVVEARLLAEHDPMAGTFSDFIWSFDTETGHVLSATVDGTVRRTLDWGIVRTHTRARLSFRMDTLGSAGYHEPRNYLGQPINYFCEPDEAKGCVRVLAQPYDATTGYVNAVGPIEVESLIMRLRTFSTIGEAVFSEFDPDSPDESPRHQAAAGLAAGLNTAP